MSNTDTTTTKPEVTETEAPAIVSELRALTLRPEIESVVTEVKAKTIPTTHTDLCPKGDAAIKKEGNGIEGEEHDVAWLKRTWAAQARRDEAGEKRTMFFCNCLYERTATIEKREAAAAAAAVREQAKKDKAEAKAKEAEEAVAAKAAKAAEAKAEAEAPATKEVKTPSGPAKVAAKKPAAKKATASK